ncbi:MAG TPA: glycosyltransferase family 1 protein [Bdellovibrionota bacterium]|nr:glycosyltransferase family 1 protein [Bdellovibrionota bacterium]
MKIGFDAKRVFHNFRGLGNYSRTLVDGLMEYYPSDDYHLYTPAFGDFRSLDWHKAHPTAKVHTPENFLAKLAHPLWRSFGLRGQILAEDLDIYHGLSHEIPFGLQEAKVKTVVTVHDLIFLRYPEFFPWVDRQTYRQKIKYATRAADCVVAVCEQTKQDLVDFMYVPESRIKVVYQSCSPAFYEAPVTSKKESVLHKHGVTEPYVLSVGALEPRKNTVALVEAFGQIKDEVPHHLVIVGRGKWEYRKEVEAAIRASALTARVKILQDVENEDLTSFYAGADLLAYPSHFEGFGIPIVEAQFIGTPVVTSTGSCFAESGGEAALYVDPKSSESIADGMLKVLTSRDLHEQMAKRGRAHAQKFHLRETSKNIHQLYLDLR